jgi:hypothetical protein
MDSFQDDKKKLSSWLLCDGFSHRSTSKHYVNRYDALLSRIKQPDNISLLDELEFPFMKDIMQSQVADVQPFVATPDDLKTQSERALWEEYRMKMISKPHSLAFKSSNISGKKKCAPTTQDFMHIIAAHARLNVMVIENNGLSAKPVS